MAVFPLRRLDALLLGILLLARVRIDTWAAAANLPLRQQDVARHPFLGHILSPQAMKLLAEQRTVDPIGLLLIVGAIACFLVYLLVDEFVVTQRQRYGLKLVLVWLIILVTVFAPSLELALLRQGSGPASYSHDGGVIQTEITVDYLLSGRNPYVENYLNTPLAEWGINQFRTALYHYPYLPWTFIFSTPFKLLADQAFGWFDERFVYLLLFALTLLLLPGLTHPPPRQPEGAEPASREMAVVKNWHDMASLLLVMTIGLNPLMGSDLIYGQNDSFVLAWVVISLWLLLRARRSDRPATRWYLASAAAFGLACASKPTAWFLAPFYLLLLASLPPCARASGGWRDWLRRAVRFGWPAALVFVLFVGPYFVWNPGAMIDDVWSWSAGTSAMAYQIWGWGASNLVLALGWVPDRFAYWPFWLPELLLGLPLMALLLWRQAHDNTVARACWSYALFLLAFFFFSRFLNENYLSYILAFIALGALVQANDQPVLFGS